jgi:hypothetical protein
MNFSYYGATTQRLRQLLSQVKNDCLLPHIIKREPHSLYSYARQYYDGLNIDVVEHVDARDKDEVNHHLQNYIAEGNPAIYPKKHHVLFLIQLNRDCLDVAYGYYIPARGRLPEHPAPLLLVVVLTQRAQQVQRLEHVKVRVVGQDERAGFSLVDATAAVVVVFILDEERVKLPCTSITFDLAEYRIIYFIEYLEISMKLTIVFIGLKFANSAMMRCIDSVAVASLSYSLDSLFKWSRSR